MRVLIIAHDFPPLNTIGARRPASWYQYFPKNGIYPIVITKSWEDASSNSHEIASQIGADEIIIEQNSDHSIIRVPLIKLLPEKLLIKYGDSRFLMLRKTLTFFYLILSYPFSFFDKNALIFRVANDFLKYNKVDCIIATGEPFILFKHASRLSRKYRIPWIADFRDGWFLNHVTSQRKGIIIKWLRRWELFFERKYLSSCKFITSVDPLLASKLSELHKKKAYVIYNGFEEFFPMEQENRSAGLPLVLSYAGTVYPGHQAEKFLQAVDDLHSSGKIFRSELELLFLGIEFSDEQHHRILQYSSNASLYIKTSKRLPHKDAVRIIRKADFLVVFTDQKQPVIPAKTFEYIASRRPVLVILNDHSILANLVTGLHAGVVIDSLEELKNFLLEKIEAKRNHLPLFNDKLDEMKALKYSRETQAAELAAVLKSNLS